MVGATLRERLGGIISRKAPASEFEEHQRALKAKLDNATRAAVSVNISQGSLDAVVEASNSAEDRRIIMQHIHSCIAESRSCQWRCVYLGLAVLEELLQKGPPELVAETAAGVHFDMVQRLSFLEKYEYGFDQRVQSLIQRRALALRTAWQEQSMQVELAISETTGPTASAAHDAKSGYSSDDSGGEVPLARQAQGQKAAPEAASARTVVDMLGFQDDSTTDGELSDPSSVLTEAALGVSDPAVASPPPPLVDLLGGAGDVSSSGSLAPASIAVASSITPQHLLQAAQLLAAGQASMAPTPAPPAATLEPTKDWLAVAQGHGLYNAGKPGAGDLLPASPAGIGDLLSTGPENVGPSSPPPAAPPATVSSASDHSLLDF